MSLWRFELMSDDDARAILAARNYSIDTLADRIKARRLLARCYLDSGESPPPLRHYERCARCNGTRGRRCSLCSGRGYLENERPEGMEASRR